MIHVTLPYPPTTNNLYITRGNRRIKSPEALKYRAGVHAILLSKKVKKIEGPITLVVSVYRPRKSGDLDNTLKAIGDSLTGIAWNDDSQVVCIHAYRHDDKENPRAEVTVREFWDGNEDVD